MIDSQTPLYLGENKQKKLHGNLCHIESVTFNYYLQVKSPAPNNCKVLSIIFINTQACKTCNINFKLAIILTL